MIFWNFLMGHLINCIKFEPGITSETSNTVYCECVFFCHFFGISILNLYLQHHMIDKMIHRVPIKA